MEESWVHTIFWLVINGLAAIWIMRLVFELMAGNNLARPVLLMAEAIFG